MRFVSKYCARILCRGINAVKIFSSQISLALTNEMCYNTRKQGGDSMSVLSGFKVFNFNEGVPYLSITTNGVTFNKSVVMKLDYPDYVLLLIDDRGQRIAVQACEQDTPNAVQFYKPNKRDVISVRWNGKDLLNTIQGITGWNLRETAYRVDGVLLRDERAMIFDLNSATEMK